MKIAVLLFCAIAEETSTLILKEALAETCLIDERSHRSQSVLVGKNEPAIAIQAKGAPFLGLAKFNQKKKD